MDSFKLNDDFLSTLPANIRTDFMDEMNNDPDEKNYVNPDTRISKLESALREAENTLEKIKIDLDAEEDSIDSLELRRFGANFFSSFQSTFLPINQPNASNNYILDANDELSIQTVGNKNKDYKLRIKRDGSINLPDVGKVTLAGLSLENATSVIKNKLSQAVLGTQAFVTLSGLRDISILVVGNIQNPGMYTLKGGSTFLSVLDAAGGINDNGSFRNISHKRNGTLIQNIDLYELFVNGNLFNTAQLRDGDVILVNPKLSEVRVSGSFFNPAIFEVTEDDTLNSLISYAQPKGVNPDNEVIIERFSSGKKIIFKAKFGDKSSLIDLQNGDSISYSAITPIFSKAKTVFIKGEVNIPGEFTISDETKLSELIKIAGGYSKQAYPKGGILIRERAKKLEKLSKEKSYNELIRYIVSSPNFASILVSPDSKGILTFMSLLKDYEPAGRLISEFELPLLENNPELDRVLEDGDTIHIPSYNSEVYVFGEVMNPGAFSYNEAQTLNDYIKLAGNFSRVADKERVLVILPNGSAKQFPKTFLNNLARRKFFDIPPGSTIYVPQEIGKLDGINLAATVSPILSSVALSLASLNSINN